MKLHPWVDSSGMDNMEKSGIAASVEAQGGESFHYADRPVAGYPQI